MSLSFCVLGSGSGGNSTLVLCDNATSQQRTCVLIDAGLSPRATGKRMAALGVSLHDISTILLTHLDCDHFNAGWLKVIERQDLCVHVHKRHRNAAWRAGLTAKHAMLFDDCISLAACGVEIASVLLAHDDLGSVGYVLQHNGFRLGYATDLGQVPPMLLKQFCGLHALAIESNYDRDMQLASPRPVFLKRRIMGGSGHLSNEQSLEAVHQIAEQSTLSHIALLHLSRQCNDPQLVRTLYTRHAPHLLDRLIISDQFQPSPMMRVIAGESVLRTQRPAILFESKSKTKIRQMSLFSQG